jgi:large subunit ribosomal protein L4
MFSAALRSIFSELVRQDRLVVTESVSLNAPKTRELAGMLNKLGLDNVLIVNEAFDENVYLSARNLQDVGICDAGSVDPVVLMRFERVLITLPALKMIEERLS